MLLDIKKKDSSEFNVILPKMHYLNFKWQNSIKFLKFNVKANLTKN